MVHEVSQEQIEDLACDRLSKEEAREVQSHVFECDDCLLRLIETTLKKEEWEQRQKRISHSILVQ